jgi:hypothetical protein
MDLSRFFRNNIAVAAKARVVQCESVSNSFAYVATGRRNRSWANPGLTRAAPPRGALSPRAGIVLVRKKND